MPKSATAGTMPSEKRSVADRFLSFIERAGNKLPSPAMLFIYCLFIALGLSFVFSLMSFDMVDPRSGEAIQVNNLLTGTYLANFLASSVTTFTSFAPLGVVLVAIMGVGVAETSGFINTHPEKSTGYDACQVDYSDGSAGGCDQ